MTIHNYEMESHFHAFKNVIIVSLKGQCCEVKRRNYATQSWQKDNKTISVR